MKDITENMKRDTSVEGQDLAQLIEKNNSVRTDIKGDQDHDQAQMKGTDITEKDMDPNIIDI